MMIEIPDTFDREKWIDCLDGIKFEYDFRCGYQFVYGSWSTLENSPIAFLSLNPGRPNKDSLKCGISDEVRGNTYLAEKEVTKSKITSQFLKLVELLQENGYPGLHPNNVLTGVVTPFRSRSWKDLSKTQRDISCIIGTKFWHRPLNRDDLNLIFVCSKPASDIVVDIMDAMKVRDYDAQWGNVKIRLFKSGRRKVLIQLPHLSRYTLLSKEYRRDVIVDVLHDAARL